MNLDAIVNSYDVRGLVPDLFDPTTAAALTAAFVDEVVVPDGFTAVVLGRDLRHTSQEISDAVVSAVTARGVDLIDLGLCSTAEVYFASGVRRLPGVMITASHQPSNHNGLKFCRAEAGPVDAESGLTAVATRAQRYLDSGQPEIVERPGKVIKQDVLADYATYLRSLVDLSGIRPLVVVVDAGNGMAGLTVPAVLAAGETLAPIPVRLVPVNMNLNPDLPNRMGTALESENLADLRRAVLENDADLGLAFDVDADRCMVVDETGATVTPSTISAVIGLRVVEKEQQAGREATVVHNLITSRAVPDLMTAAGAWTVATRVGHSFMKRAMAGHDAVFGGEHSGHYYFRDFFFADDGLLAALNLVAALGEQPYPMSVLADLYQPYATSGEINLAGDDLGGIQQRVLDAYRDEPDIEIDLTDGVTISHWGSVPQWWFNLRGAETEPVLRLNVEAADEDMMEKVRDDVTMLVDGDRQ